MTDLRTAAQQALEALDAYSWEQVDAARTALKAALAEPENWELRRLREELERCKQVCAATAEAWREEAALAEPVQEPVAGRAFLERILTAMEGVIDVADRKTDEFDALRSCVIDLTLMLHTAPPQRKPLTEEEIDIICKKAREDAEAGWPYGANYVLLTIRGVERAHGIV